MQAEMAQISNNNNSNNMLFHFPPASIQGQSNNDEKQKNDNKNNQEWNKHTDNSSLSELMLAVQNYPAVWDITTRSYRDLH